MERGHLSISEDWQSFDADLSLSMRSLWLARLRRDALVGFDRSLLIVCIASVVCCVWILVVGSHAFPATKLWWWGFVSVFAVGAVCAGHLAGGLLRRPTRAEVAERLDLATNSDNRIATAEVLLRGGVTTGFEKAALADGIDRLSQTPEVSMRLFGERARLGRNAGFAAASVALLIAVALLPRERSGDFGAFKLDAATRVVAAVSAAPAVQKPVQRREDPKLSAVSAASIPAAAPNSGSSVNPMAVDSKADSSGAAAAAGDSGAAASAAAAPPKSERPAGTPGADDLPLDVSSAARSQPLPRSAEAAAVSSAGAGSEHGAPPAGGSKSNPVPSGQGKPNPSGESKNGPASGGGPPPGAATPEPNKSSGDGEAADSDQPTPDSSGFSMSPTNPSDVSGDGRAVGQSQPKKSRGVAPLLLGTRQPDLFQGRPLPGPDERTKLQLPSRRDPGPPAEVAPVATRSTEERAIGRYRVPPESTDVVGNYFQRFHADADVFSTSVNAVK